MLIGSFFLHFHEKICKFYKEQLFKDIYPWKCWHFLTKTWIKRKFASENYNLKSYGKKWGMNGYTLQSFENSEKSLEFVKKKKQAHSFASNNSIFNQNKPTHTSHKLIQYENWKSNILSVSIFNKLFEVDFFFLKT